jgi:hypothetical protein
VGVTIAVNVNENQHQVIGGKVLAPLGNLSNGHALLNLQIRKKTMPYCQPVEKL